MGNINKNRFTESEPQCSCKKDINVLALVKGEERYIFLFDDEHRADTLRTLGRFASNPDLAFTWYDAAILSKKIREGAFDQDIVEEIEE